jgi:thioesterase domain-containing protein
MAAHHLANLRGIAPAGPYRLCGRSFGGIVAFEMAQQLAATGDSVSSLVLLDSSTFGLRVDWTWTEQAAQWIRRLCARSALLRNDGPRGALAYVRARARAIWRWVRNGVGLSWQVVDAEVADAIAPSDLPLAKHLLQTMVEYSPKPYPGGMTLIKATEFRSGDAAFDPRNGWRKFVKGDLRIHHVPGNHLTMLDGENVEPIGRLLNRLFSMAGSPSRAGDSPM